MVPASYECESLSERVAAIWQKSSSSDEFTFTLTANGLKISLFPIHMTYLYHQLRLGDMTWVEEVEVHPTKSYLSGFMPHPGNILEEPHAVLSCLISDIYSLRHCAEVFTALQTMHGRKGKIFFRWI
jgi:hypothetical protein